MTVSDKVRLLAESYAGLNEAERHEFVALVAPTNDEKIGAEWHEELNRRTLEIDRGNVELVEGEDFLQRLRAV